MRIVALHIGMPRRETFATGEFLTAGAKSPVDAARLTLDGFEGDGVADHRHHGGRDRTACVYPADAYAWWRTTHGYHLHPGAFSENLSVDGLSEADICIGDIVRMGEAVAQVTLPRDPCRTLDRINGISALHRLARESGHCGFHMRTLEEGVVRVGDTFQVVTAHPACISVAVALDLYHGRSIDREVVRRLLAMPEFAEEGKQVLARLQ